MKRMLCYVAATMVVVSTVRESVGQVSEPGQVYGTGTQVLNRRAETMRMRVDLIIRGKDMKEAVARFKERKQAALTTLETLGAIKETVRLDDPQINQQMAQQQAQITGMIRDRTSGRTRKKANETSGPVYLSASLQADWKLTGKNAEELMLAAHEIQENVKAADLSGVKDATKFSPEEEELQAEMSQMKYTPYGNQQPGQAQFIFVAKITEAEHEKLYADAFAKSREAAERLAKAASLKIVKLSSVTDNSRSNFDTADMMSYRAMGYAQYAVPQMPEPLADTHEATGASPGKVSVHASITATFLVE